MKKLFEKVRTVPYVCGNFDKNEMTDDINDGTCTLGCKGANVAKGDRCPFYVEAVDAQTKLQSDCSCYSPDRVSEEALSTAELQQQLLKYYTVKDLKGFVRTFGKDFTKTMAKILHVEDKPEYVDALRNLYLKYTEMDELDEDSDADFFYKYRQKHGEDSLKQLKSYMLKISDCKIHEDYSFILEQIREQKFNTAAKGLLDTQTANDFAKNKKGIVIPDPEDKTKYAVLVATNEASTGENMEAVKKVLSISDKDFETKSTEEKRAWLEEVLSTLEDASTEIEQALVSLDTDSKSEGPFDNNESRAIAESVAGDIVAGEDFFQAAVVDMRKEKFDSARANAISGLKCVERILKGANESVDNSTKNVSSEEIKGKNVSFVEDDETKQWSWICADKGLNKDGFATKEEAKKDAVATIKEANTPINNKTNSDSVSADDLHFDEIIRSYEEEMNSLAEDIVEDYWQVITPDIVKKIGNTFADAVGNGVEYMREVDVMDEGKEPKKPTVDKETELISKLTEKYLGEGKAPKKPTDDTEEELIKKLTEKFIKEDDNKEGEPMEVTKPAVVNVTDADKNIQVTKTETQTSVVVTDNNDEQPDAIIVPFPGDDEMIDSTEEPVAVADEDDKEEDEEEVKKEVVADEEGVVPADEEEILNRMKEFNL